MIKKEKIGSVYTVKYKGLDFVAHITDDPSQYDYYRSLGLDVFEEDERTLIIYELERLEIPFKKNSKTITLKNKLNDYFTESDNESESDIL